MSDWIDDLREAFRVMEREKVKTRKEENMRAHFVYVCVEVMDKRSVLEVVDIKKLAAN